MLSYAHATNHEKIIRGLSIGLALTAIGRAEESEALLEQMVDDADSIIRYGGMFALGLAYAGTSSSSAIQRLLHHAVSDVSDDVRRAAVMCLGFVLLNQPGRCPEIVRLLSVSYNPHVRYGAAIAVGIACAGTGLQQATELLEPMMNDSVDFVRQGVFIAISLVNLQQPEHLIQGIRKGLEKSVNNRHEEVMSKMGAIMATGIIDAGGRNMTVELRSPTGFNKPTALVGLAVFLQYWYWFPLSYFISLSFKPTALIALDSTLKAPQLQVKCNCKPSLFAYAKPINLQTTTDISKIPSAILSITAKKDRARLRKQKDTVKASSSKSKDVEMTDANNGNDIEGDKLNRENHSSIAASTHTNGHDGIENNKIKANANGDNNDTQEPKNEPNTYFLQNPARVVPQQVEYVEFPKDGRWQAVNTNKRVFGIIVCKDSSPQEKIDYVREDASLGLQNQSNINGPNVAVDGNVAGNPDGEVSAPEPFEYVPRDS
eukprot:TRINITY_DN1831_c0_g1_i4.p2 TRINITY_DN1831_c0_g1~~TRINITY_DN1831_c0_g1_i4.p2  ORF type:complete len:487 (-),score=45.52 TRINITY_DN1831_c0_g1_i4:479-1939(-)